MASASPTVSEPLRISADDVKARVAAGESVTVLDVRNPKVWDAGNVKIRGAIRVSPDQLRIDPAWPRDRLTVVY
jgi:rhodanese-related sulfurtransferase